MLHKSKKNYFNVTPKSFATQSPSHHNSAHYFGFQFGFLLVSFSQNDIKKRYKINQNQMLQNVCVFLSFMVYPSHQKLVLTIFDTLCFGVAKTFSVHFVIVEIDLTHILFCSQCADDRNFLRQPK